VPTLVWQEPGGKVASLYESLVCNEYIADLPGGRSLLPDDAAQRAQARLAIDQVRLWVCAPVCLCVCVRGWLGARRCHGGVGPTAGSAAAAVSPPAPAVCAVPLAPCDAPARAQFGAKVGPAFGKAMFAEDASSGPAADELTAALQWLEGELNKHEGPLFMGKDLTLVRRCCCACVA
jgi:glutathione S-transferase